MVNVTSHHGATALMTTRKQQEAQRKDPRSAAFRAAVKGWAFSDSKRVVSMIAQAEPYAWLEDHHDTLRAMRGMVAREQARA